MFRQSTRQLAQCARLSSARTTVRQSVPRLARLPTVSTSRTLRFYSAEPPSRKPDEGDKKRARKPSDAASRNKKEAAPGEQDEYPLPKGYVRITDEEFKQLEDIFKIAPAPRKAMMDETLELVKKTGIPVELKQLLEKHRTEGLSIMDGLKIPSIIFNMAEKLGDAANKKTDFDSNKPGEQKPGPRKQQQQGEQQQQQGKQEGQQEGQQEDRQQFQGQQQKGQGQEGGKKGGPFNGADFMGWVVTGLVAYPIYSFLMPGELSREITWQELRNNFLDKGLVEKMTVVNNRVRVDLNREAARSVYPETSAEKYTYYFTIGSVDAFERKLEEAQRELGIPAGERIPVSYATEGQWTNMFLAFGPTIVLVGLLAWLSRRAGGGAGGGAGGMFGFGKSKAKMFNHDSAVKVKFSDVAGMDEAKVEIMEFVSFLRTPERFQRLGAKIPRGAILSGPPGTGKTLLAKATAGESQVPFFSVSGSEFVEMFVGVGASRVRDLFATARKNAPCIIFIDEIDAIGKTRSDGSFRGGGNDEREATLNQILTEMDGFNTSEQVVVLAGTNRPDILDGALMRPGRFDRHIHIDRPTMQGRKEIFKVHLGKIVTEEDMDYLTGRLASLTPGFAGADIANAVNEAALIAARANAKTVAMVHFEQAIERVIGGLERKSLVLNPEEKRVVAYHEAGHAICGWFFRWADPLLKVSIIPRGKGALGYAQYLPAADSFLMNTNQLMDRMAMTLGGRVSEELHFPTVTSGASDDFNKVTRMAQTMVTQWGMSEKVGPLYFQTDPNQLQKPFAEATAQVIDAEVRRIVDQAYKQCKDLLTAKKKEVGIVAEELLRKEMLTRDDIIRLLGPREWPEKEEFAKYFDGRTGASVPPGGLENTDTPDDSGPQPSGVAFDGEPEKPKDV